MAHSSWEGCVILAIRVCLFYFNISNGVHCLERDRLMDY
uniref:Uncharacterized protein n=1 Tax=Arundo donax TaxID=35708 RepID=A0A0A8XSI0_ARUDO